MTWRHILQKEHAEQHKTHIHFLDLGSELCWTQNFEYQKWPDQIFRIVNFVFPHNGHFGLGGGGPGRGGGLLLWLSTVLVSGCPPPPPFWVQQPKKEALRHLGPSFGLN